MKDRSTPRPPIVIVEGTCGVGKAGQDTTVQVHPNCDSQRRQPQQSYPAAVGGPQNQQHRKETDVREQLRADCLQPRHHGKPHAQQNDGCPDRGPSSLPKIPI